MTTIDTFIRLFDRADWMDRAACRGLDKRTRDRLFFPPQGANMRAVEHAKAICAGCPVRDECLEYALTNLERFGIWGGKSEKERRVLRARRRCAA